MFVLMKRKLLIITVIVLQLCILKASAQYVGMNMGIGVQWNLPKNMSHFIKNNQNYLFNDNYTYNLILKFSPMKSFKSSIHYDSTAHKTYLLLVDKDFKKSDSAHRYQRIYPDPTKYKYVQRDGGDVMFTGTPNDSCWLFKIITGELSAYTSFAKYGTDKAPILNGLQMNGGTIQQFNLNLLESIVVTDEDAFKQFKKKNYIACIIAYNKHKIHKRESDQQTEEQQ
jgi:hypothetical protein